MVDALITVSILSLIATGLLLIFWLSLHYTKIQLMVLAPALLIFTGSLWVGSTVRPDPLSGFIILLIAYLVLERQSSFWALFVSMLAITARPDNLIFAILVSLYLRFFLLTSARISNIFFGFSIMCMISLCILLVILTHAYGWRLTFYHSFIQHLSYPESTQYFLYPMDYLRQLYWSILNSASSLDFFLFILYVFLAIIFVYFSSSQAFRYWIVLCIGVVIVHYLLFPSFELRFFSPYYMAIFVPALLEYQHRRQPVY